MSCTKCDGNRLLSVSGKSNDLCWAEVPHLGLESDGYAPIVKGVCHGDYVEVTVCLDCGTVQGFKPMSDKDIILAFDEEADVSAYEEDDVLGDEFPVHRPE